VSVVFTEPQPDQSLAARYDFVDVPTPPAGANAIWLEGLSQVFAVVAARALFVADGNAANRLVSLDYIARSVAYVRNTPAQVFVASSSTQLEWQSNLGTWEGAANAPSLVPVLAIPLPQGVTVQFTADSIQAGDQFSALHLTVLRWTAAGAESG
jgi:hypothetical protein